MILSPPQKMCTRSWGPLQSDIIYGLTSGASARYPRRPLPYAPAPIPHRPSPPSQITLPPPPSITLRLLLVRHEVVSGEIDVFALFAPLLCENLPLFGIRRLLEEGN